MKVVYFGTPHFAANVLTYLLDHDVNITAVISRTDKPKGRSGAPVPTPVKEVALQRNIPIYQPEKVSAPEFAATIEQLNADLFVVVAYGEILKQHVLDAPAKGCINLHASLLPKYRGAAPIQRCIIEGETESGVSIMYMVKKMDAGDVISQTTVPIGSDMTFAELEQELCRVGSVALLDAIRRFEKGLVEGVPQNESEVTFAQKIELEDCQIDWNKPAQEIHNLVRGVNPYPSAWCFVKIGDQKKRMKIIKTNLVDGKGAPGTRLRGSKNELIIACGEGALSLKEVQLEGKKAMPPDVLMRGMHEIQFHDCL